MQMSRLIRQIVVVLAVLVAPVAQASRAYTSGTVPDPKKNGQEYYVANPDGILSGDDVAFLNNCAQRLEQQTRVEMCVVAVNSIGDADCFTFTYELFQRWGIGKKGQNTGVLIVFVLMSHDVRIMTGTGIEGVLPDARCSQIINNVMIPSFREGKYGEGICLGALRIYELCTGGDAPEELLNMKSVTNRGKYAKASSVEKEGGEAEWYDGDVAAWVIFVILLAVLCGFIYFVWKIGGPRGGRGGGSGYTGGWYAGGGGYSGGGGGFGGSWGGGSTCGGGAGGHW